MTTTNHTTNDADDPFDLVHRLVTRQLEEPDDSENAKALQQLLANDPAARRTYVDYMQEVVHIASRLGQADQHQIDTLIDSPHAPFDASKAPSSISSWISRGKISGLLAIAGLALLAILLVRDRYVETPRSDAIAADRTNESAYAQDLRSAAVATITETTNVAYEDQDDTISELDRVTLGQELRLKQGRVKLVFDSGVEALVVGPCHVKIQEPNKVFCLYGQISAIVSDKRKGFVVQTPTAMVTDLGTEFGISISKSGKTDVAVFEGEVNVAFGTEQKNEQMGGYSRVAHLVQGEAASVDRDGISRRIYSIDNRQLPSVREIKPLRVQERVIASVRDNISERSPENRKFYRIAHSGFREDCNAFVDRKHQWNGLTDRGLPRELLGADYVMPFNDDKFEGDLQVTVSISQPSVLYILFCDNTVIPNWLSEGFSRTGLRVGLDEGPTRYHLPRELGTGPGVSIDNEFSVWKRDVHEPEEIQLGSFSRPENVSLGYNMYGIAAVAKTPTTSNDGQTVVSADKREKRNSP